MWFSRKKAKPVQVAFDKKPLTIVQATDMHYITRKLTDNGEAFRKTADAADGKVLLYSEELMDAFCAEMAQKKPQLLILSGDLSFNGEYESHKALAAKLAGLKEAGTKVLVIPGNHDIDYAGAASFSGKEIKKARSISAQEFRKLYAPFGYNDAGDCAPDTLSYLTDLGGFRILMLDTTTVSMCRVTDRTLTWAEKMLQEAAEDRVPVLAVSHQNLMAHNAMFAKGFRIEGGEKLLSLYEKYGVLANLSGHMHLQHIRTGDCHIRALPFPEPVWGAFLERKGAHLQKLPAGCKQLGREDALDGAESSDVFCLCKELCPEGGGAADRNSAGTAGKTAFRRGRKGSGEDIFRTELCLFCRKPHSAEGTERRD